MKRFLTAASLGLFCMAAPFAFAQDKHTHAAHSHGAGTLDQADACLAGPAIGLVVLDARWPDALAVTRQWREGSQVGIMLIGDDTERLAALEFGADEYLMQPVQPRELLARTRNLLRRVCPSVPLDTHLKRFASWTLDTGRRRLKAGDSLIRRRQDRCIQLGVSSCQRCAAC